MDRYMEEVVINNMANFALGPQAFNVAPTDDILGKALLIVDSGASHHTVNSYFTVCKILLQNKSYLGTVLQLFKAKLEDPRLASLC